MFNDIYPSLCVAEVSQTGAGVYKSPEGAGDLTEDQPHWVIITCLSPVNYTDLFNGAHSLRKPHFPLVKNSSFCARAAAGTQRSFWCPDIPHCFNLPSSTAPLHRASPHNAQMVAIVLPRPLPHSVKLCCVCQRDRKPGGPMLNKAQKHTQGYFHVYTFLTFESKQSFSIVLSYFVRDIQYCAVQYTPTVFVDVM